MAKPVQKDAPAEHGNILSITDRMFDRIESQ